MEARLDAFAVNPEAMKAMVALEQTLTDSGLEHSLYELVKIRASQINGCAYCIYMHTSDARASGETEMRINLLPAWRESPLYTPRERAALAWTEALTQVADTRAPDHDYEEVKRHFDDREVVWLTLLIGAINTWNRLAIGFRTIHPMDETAALDKAQTA